MDTQMSRGAGSGFAGKILGIDYGEKRIGLSISDETLTFARELEILSPKEFWDRIKPIIEEHQVVQIVLGWPLNMSGQATEKTREVESFRNELLKKLSARGGSASGRKVESETGLPVEITDERLSSQMAQTIIGGNKDLDSLAAQILLQNYLNKQKFKP